MNLAWHASRLIGVTLAALALLACVDTESGSPLPSTGEVLSVELTEGSRLVYEVQLAAKDILRLRVDQMQLDAVLSIESPNGKTKKFDSGNAFSGPEWLIFEAESAGKHTVEIQSAAVEFPGQAGTVSLVVEARGEAKSKDWTLLRAYQMLESTPIRGAMPEQISELQVLLESSDALPGLVRARVAYLLGLVHRYAGRPGKASNFLTAAKDGFRNFGNAWEETTALNHLGFALLQLGELEEAEEVLTRANKLSHQTDQPRTRASTWSNLGILGAAQGRHSEALRHYRRAEELFEVIGDDEGLAYCRNNIGVQLLFLGEVEAGLRALREAADLWRAIGRILDLGTTSLSLAWGMELRSELADDPGDIEKALAFSNEAVAIFEHADSRWDLAVALERRGWYRFQLGDLRLALQDLERSTEVVGDPLDRMHLSWVDLGQGAIHARLGNQDQAQISLKRALNGFEEFGHHTGQVEAYLELARLERSSNQRDEAADLLELAIELVEGPRNRLQTDEFRRSYLAIHQDIYEELVDLWAEASWKEASAESPNLVRAQRWAEKALKAAERGRAKGLLDHLTRLGHRWADTEPGEGLRRVMDPLEASIDAEAAEHARMERLQALETNRSISVDSPTENQSVDIESIYGLLDDGTAVVLYSLGSSRGWAFLVTAGSIRAFHLSPRRKIESAARLVQQLLPRWDTPGFKTAAQESLPGLRELVLSPLGDLPQVDRMVVVASGALLGVPCSALPGSDGNELAVSHSFVYLPSLSVLKNLRRRSESDRQLSDSEFTIIADPVFSQDDPRILASSSTEDPGYVWRPLPRLPSTGVEAHHIKILLAGLPDRPQLKMFQGFEAEAKLFRNGALERSRFLHIATHGLVDDEDPTLATLVFSLFDVKGRPQNGFLPARDLYGTNLSADLVVLSACGTGKGRPVRGEGLVGLSHAFFAAGARHLLVSLWDVDDDATAELMKRYYSHLFKDRIESSRALAKAQNEMRQLAQWSSPRHWAGFVAWGDWKLTI